MTTKHAFKIGFAEKLAELGVAPDQLSEALEKVAQASPSGVLTKQLLEGLKGLGGAALLAAPLAGAGIGYGMQRSQTVSKPDIQHVKDIAILKEYQAAVDKMEKQRERESSHRLITG